MYDGRRRTTEAYLSYKLTKWTFGSGELKKDVLNLYNVKGHEITLLFKLDFGS